MSDYTKTTDFSAKDALASGDPEKLAVGADVDAEFDAIAAAVATKEDKTNKGAASGYCPLDGAADVPDDNLQSRVMRYDSVGTVTSGKGDAWVTLTDAATIAVDASLGNSFEVTLGGNRTMGEPSSPLDGQTIVFLIKQDATGGRTLAWNAKFKWPSATAPTLSTGANDVDMVTGKYHETDDLWYMVTSGLDLS